MKVWYRFRSDANITTEDIIQRLKHFHETGDFDERISDDGAEIRDFICERGDGTVPNYLRLIDSDWGDISLEAWHHYGLMIGNDDGTGGEIFADLGDKGPNHIEERKRLKEFLANDGNFDNYIDLDDIIM